MILISGEALIDLIPDRAHPGRYDAALGGSPYNVAIGLARLGAPAAFVSRISRDANGEALAAALVAAGVDLTYVARDAKPSPLAFVTRGAGETGERYAFYLDATAYDEAWPFPAVWPAGARHLHVGSFCAVDSVPRAWSAEDIDSLKDLAASVMTEIGLKRSRDAAEAASGTSVSKFGTSASSGGGVVSRRRPRSRRRRSARPT